MYWKKKALYIFLIAFLAINSSLNAQKSDSVHIGKKFKNWNRFSFNLGGFFAGMNSGLRIGSKQLGLGIDINLEDALGLQTSNFVFRGDALYRFGKTKRHGIKVSYFSFTRTARKILESQIEIGDFVFPIGTDLSSRSDLSILNTSYRYSFFMDERINLGASFGLFIMPLRFEVGVTGDSEKVTDIFAPLPVIGLNSDFAVTPKFYIKQGFELLYLKVDNFTGAIADINIRFEYNAWEHFGFGLGINIFNLKIQADGEDSPPIDFVGNIEMGYTGLLFYGRYFF